MNHTRHVTFGAGMDVGWLMMMMMILQEMEVGLCALVLGHCACDSVACTVSLFAIGFHRLVEASTSPGSLNDAVDLLKLQDGASLEALLREEANLEAAIAGALPEVNHPLPLALSLH